MKFVTVFIIVMTCLTPARMAFALSCMPVAWDANAIASADLIFEGSVTAAEPITITKDSLEKNVRYEFAVQKLWKGKLPWSLNQINIIRNTYWGDGFTVGDSYLVTAIKTDIGYVVPLCRESTPLDQAADKIKVLEQILGK